MFICKVCERRYSSQKSLNKHDREKHHIYKEIFYECNQDGCGQSFNSKLALMKHKTQHRNRNKAHLISQTTRSKRILCSVDNCEDMFCGYFMLREHLSTIHKYTLEEETYSFSSIYGKYLQLVITALKKKCFKLFIKGTRVT